MASGPTAFIEMTISANAINSVPTAFNLTTSEWAVNLHRVSRHAPHSKLTGFNVRIRP